MQTPSRAIDFLPKYESVRKSEEGKRLYQTPEGTYYSVTTILSGTRDESSLVAWRESIGEERAERIVRTACHRGGRAPRQHRAPPINGRGTQTQPPIKRLLEVNSNIFRINPQNVGL